MSHSVITVHKSDWGRDQVWILEYLDLLALNLWLFDLDWLRRFAAGLENGVLDVLLLDNSVLLDLGLEPLLNVLVSQIELGHLTLMVGFLSGPLSKNEGLVIFWKVTVVRLVQINASGIGLVKSILIVDVHGLVILILIVHLH